MELERLPRGTYDKHNQDYRLLEGEWIEATIEDFRKEAKSTQSVLKMTQPDKDTSFLDWEHVSESLKEGRSVELIKGIFRMQTADLKCPLCGSSIKGDGAISRRDNATRICTICSQQEAFDDVTDVRR